MEKLKNILKSDTPTDESSQAGATGKITGQGSHFPHQNEPTATQPSTVTGTEPSTRGPTDVSAVKPDPIQASSTAGPEQGGSEHVNTIPAESVSATQPTVTKHEAQSYNVTNADFPRTESSVDGSGTAAIGTTTTDPLSYKKPESGAGAAGVGAGAASVAATTAFTSSQERGPGHENPYRTTDIDPRVDGGAKSSAPGSTTAHSTVAGGSLAAAGATTAYSQVTEGRSSQPQSTLTTTTDPTDRSATYSQATTSQGLDEAKPSTTSASQPADATEEKTGVVGKVLGAVGLGGVAGAAVAKLSGDKEAVVDDSSEPVTTTGITSYTSPTHQGPGTHHRKESIPTTAYPAGVDSPGAINAPIGGTRASATESVTGSTPPVASQTSDNSTGHKAATAVAAAGAGAAAIGAAAVGNERYAESKDLRENITGQQTGSAQPTTEAAHGQATTGVPHEAYTESKALRDNATTGQTATSTATDSTKKEEDHTARNAAIGAGAGAAVAGAGAAGAAEYSKKEAEKAEAEAAKQQAARQKEIEEQQKAAQKHAEKEQKAAEKEEKAHQKAVEKEEKKHQKELEKEEKKHQKEIAAAEKKHEKEEKQHQKELEKEEKERKKQAEEEEERRRQAALAASAPAAAAAAADKDKKVDHEKDVKEEEQEKKPSLFKRIFKRRKNSTTGEEEEYEAEEEDGKDVPIVAGAAAGTVAGSAALASRGHEQPLSSTATESTPVDPLASTQPPSQAGAAGFVTTGADGKPQYTVIPQPPPDASPATISDTRATDPLVAHDASTGTKTADVVGGSHTATNTTVAGTGEHGHQSLEDRIEAMTQDKFGVVEDHKR